MTPILFDLDGTLIDSLPNIHAAANAVLSANDQPPLEASVVAGFVGLGEGVFVDRLIAATELVLEERPRILSEFMRAYKVAAAETRCFAGVVPMLTDLKEKGLALGVVTNKPRAPLGPTLEAAGLVPFFDVVVAGDDLPVRKPNPEPIRHAMAELGATGCVFIGDTPIDAETAERAGVPFGMFTEGIRTVPTEAIPHDFAFSDFRALPTLLVARGVLV